MIALREGSGRGSVKRVKVLDSTAIFLGLTEGRDEHLITCEDILEELRHGGAELRAAAMKEGSLIKIVEPEERYVERIRDLSSKIGEANLSRADVKLLALALQQLEEGSDVSIITSDYAIQNIASFLGIRVEPVLHRGIKETIAWIAYCKLCGWSGDASPGSACPRCGSRLGRRPRLKRVKLDEDKDSE